MKKFFLYTLGLIQLIKLLTSNPIFLSQKEQLILIVLIQPIKMIRRQRFPFMVWVVDCCNFEAFEIMKAVFQEVVHSF